MTEQEAKSRLYSMWENGEIPANFTEDHSNYWKAVKQLMEYGYIERETLYP